MAILLKPFKKDTLLFCCSKWWGNPDLPPQVEYPMYEDYPLTFICQIDCEDIAPFDPDGLLPHEGMLYFFAAIDQFLGYEAPYELACGQWPAKAVVVKYAKHINPETFNACILVDDDDNELTEPELAIEFSAADDEPNGIKLLVDKNLDNENKILFQMNNNPELGIEFPENKVLNFILKNSDLHFGNFKRTIGVLQD